MTPADSHIQGGGSRRSPAPRPVSALPSRRARAVAFAAIIVAGICGALIGYSFVNIQCHGDCTTPEGGGAITGAIIAAVGVAVVAVLVLRAMGEWKTITEERALEEAGRAVAEQAAPEASSPEPESSEPESSEEAGSADADATDDGPDP
jgi:hypothetical protein